MAVKPKIPEEAKISMSHIAFSEHKMPEFKVVRGKPWVYFGEDNLYPEYLIKLFTRSAKHNAIITGKKEYVVGNGFFIDEDNTPNPTDPALLKFIEQVNPNESANDLLEKIALDFELHGGFYLQVIYERGSNKIAELYHIDFSNMRAGKYLDMQMWQKKGTDHVFDFYYSDIWEVYNQSAATTGLRGFNAFNPKLATGKNAQKTQIFYFKEYRPKATVYPMPDYIGAIPYVELDYEIANYHLNKVKHGFAADMFLNFNSGEPTPEGKRMLERQFTQKFTGTDRAGGWVLNFNTPPNLPPTIEPINMPDLHKTLTQLDDSVMQNIFTGHKISSPMLFGVKTPGQLGGRDEMREAMELFQSTYLNHKQQIICRVLNTLLNVGYGIKGKPLKIQPAEPLKWELPPLIIAQAMTKDEIRLNSGLTPMNIKGVTDILPPMPVQPMPTESVARTKLSAQNSVIKMMFDKRAPERKKEDEDLLISCFAKYGRVIDTNNILKSKKMRFVADLDELELDENEERMEFDKETDIGKAIAASTVAILILKYLKEHPGALFPDIAADLDISVSIVKDWTSKMVVSGLITSANKLTSAGNGAITGGNKMVVIEAVYQYDVTPGLGAPIIDTTRDFCRQLVSMGKSFTRKEIQIISAEVGYSVWLYRGGFYHNPDTNITTPYCRHDWFQHIIRRVE